MRSRFDSNAPMLTGAHFLLYSADPAADGAFFRDVLPFPSVDAGEQWLIFALPPSELGIHPADALPAPALGGHTMVGAVLSLMCDDLVSLVKDFEARGVQVADPVRAPWGDSTTIRLPGGGEIGFYQPRHPVAHSMSPGASKPSPPETHT
jgi:hypothetical protein